MDISTDELAEVVARAVALALAGTDKPTEAESGEETYEQTEIEIDPPAESESLASAKRI